MAPKKKVEEEPVELPPEPVEPPDEYMEGEFTLPDGTEYNGEYLKKGETIKFHGEGKMYGNSDTFQGTFKDGLYKQGVYKSCSGAEYTGTFRNNLFDGWGEYIWPDKRKYSGMWKNGVQHGFGKYDHFSIGVDKTVTGFSVDGRFLSNRKEQEAMKQKYLTEYSTAYIKSASAALTMIVEKLKPAEVDPKAAKGKAPPPVEEIPLEYVRHLLVPDDTDEAPEAVADRAAVAENASGPFPVATSIKAESFQAFMALFGDDSDAPGKPTVLETIDGCAKLGVGRLCRDQLRHVGQAVAFTPPEGSVEVPGTVSAIVLVNVSPEYDVSQAQWKIVLYEETPAE